MITEGAINHNKATSQRQAVSCFSAVTVSHLFVENPPQRYRSAPPQGSSAVSLESTGFGGGDGEGRWNFPEGPLRYAIIFRFVLSAVSKSGENCTPNAKKNISHVYRNEDHKLAFALLG